MVKKRLRGSGSERGTDGCGTPGGKPTCGGVIDAVAKWLSTSSTTMSGVARTLVIAELRGSNE